MIWRTIKLGIAGILSLGILTGVGGLIALRMHHGRLLSVQTKSMVPVIKKGDLVVVTHVPESQLAIGNVVTFINPKNTRETITHRIVQLPSVANGGKIVTKGDANPSVDTPISPKNVVGRADLHLPRLGFIFDFMRRPIGLAILIYVPALMIIGRELKRLAKYYEEQKPYHIPGYETAKSTASYAAKLTSSVKLGLLLFATGIIIASPAKAALSSAVTLTGNSISIAAPTSPSFANHVVIRQLVLRCSIDNGPTQARRPRIVLFNPTNEPIVMGNWHIDDNNSRFITLPVGTVLQARKMYIVAPYLYGGPRQGLDYSGDHVTLFSQNDAVVDGVSWGDDVSIFNLPLFSAAAGTRYQRVPARQDHDQPTDFKTFTRVCENPNEDVTDGTPEPAEPGQFIAVQEAAPRNDNE